MVEVTDGINDFLKGKPEHALALFDHFINEFDKVGSVKIESTKTMIGISNSHKRIAWITRIGQNFVHVVFPFKQVYGNNLCFHKIARVPGSEQHNHHLRIYEVNDVNEEVKSFMKIAYSS